MSGMADWSVEAPGPTRDPARSLLLEWLREHGIDPDFCTYVETDVVDAPLVRATIWERDSLGNLLVQGDEVVTRTVERLLRRPPPVPAWP